MYDLIFSMVLGVMATEKQILNQNCCQSIYIIAIFCWFVGLSDAPYSPRPSATILYR